MQIARRYIKECGDYSPNIQYEVIRWWYICKVSGKRLHSGPVWENCELGGLPTKIQKM